MNYQTFKKYIYKLDPENAHEVTEAVAKTLGDYLPFLLIFIRNYYKKTNCRLSQNILGIEFENPVGLGAGFDKNATMVKALEAVGFGYVEVGTVTPKPQAGNPKPRLFRYPEYNSVQNAMGFNNKGVAYFKERLKELYPYKIPIGANIGKNKITQEDKAIEDYKILIDEVKDISDYIVINISSPNTPGLRDLQNEAFIKELFTMAKSKTDRPIFLKIAPDMEVDDAKHICQSAIDTGADGIIATNTTIDYTVLPNAKDFGGISGAVLKEKSFALFKELAKDFYGKTTLISVGGISDGDEAYRRIKAGASLVQVLSALIFEGPYLVSKINSRLLELLKADGFNRLEEAVGADLR
jgi:dihydroorotate dehydrogenase